MKVRALYWWIDRWRKSTAYTDMSLEEQAAYRNLLDEAALRGGALPFNERALAKASGDATRWHKVRKVVIHKTRRRVAQRDARSGAQRDAFTRRTRATRACRTP